jgi:hypothetical protein
MNLRTSEERVRLLKIGMNGKQIEKLYLEYNGFKLIDIPILNESMSIKI